MESGRMFINAQKSLKKIERLRFIVSPLCGLDCIVVDTILFYCSCSTFANITKKKIYIFHNITDDCFCIIAGLY